MDNALQLSKVKSQWRCLRGKGVKIIHFNKNRNLNSEINQHIAALHKLSQQIEKTANTKGAVDLNSRLITELGFIQLMSLRLQALTSQQLAQEIGYDHIFQNRKREKNLFFKSPSPPPGEKSN